MDNNEQKYYVVGIKPDRNPDPAYWLDRFEAIQADNEIEAKDGWVKEREGWLHMIEFQYIRIWDVLDEKPLAWDWTKKYADMEMADARVPSLDKHVSVKMLDVDAQALADYLHKRMDADQDGDDVWDLLLYRVSRSLREREEVTTCQPKHTTLI